MGNALNFTDSRESYNNFEWKFVSTPEKFVDVSVSNYTVVCCDVNGMVWVLYEHLLFHRSWIKLPCHGIGFVTKVAALNKTSMLFGGYDKVIALNKDGILWSYKNASSWIKLENETNSSHEMVELRQISLGSQYLWGIDCHHSLWRYSENYFGHKWEKIKDNVDYVSAGEDGSVFIIQDKNEVFEYSNSKWKLIDGHFEKIAVFDKSAIFALNHLGEAYLQTPLNLREAIDGYTCNWERVFSRNLVTISIGKAAYDHVWGLNSKGEAWAYISNSDEVYIGDLVSHREINQEIDEIGMLNKRVK